ncbi:hypothetical protein HMPREF0369_02547 [Anaerostipes hadrus ATCC 29173 = JCM 17467]|nr:hypothetical protein HMPREF0369_02547 [Anaerostipes hadrus ATCC 29173 = JCM 17467]
MVFWCQEVGSQIIESAIPREYQKLVLLEYEILCFPQILFVKGFTVRLPARGCRFFIGGNTWGFFILEEVMV